MTETARTATYIGVAVVLLVVAGYLNRKPDVQTVDSLVGQVLFPNLKSPEDVAGLEIVTADDAGGTDKFRVVRGASGWTLPLHHNYPADAEKEVASAAASLIDLKVLSVVSKLPGEHAIYGVVDPEKASPGAEGAGKLVKVLDKSGNNLVRLIVGKEDKPTGEAMDSQALRYVRALPQDVVYRVAVPSAKFSTNFADWIETDLLKLDPWDITDVTLKDYTFDVVADPLGRLVQKSYEQSSTMELAFNDKDSKWSLDKLVKFEDNKPQPVEMAADEELNSVRLNEMKTALDDLKIVDVRPKPAGMTANLKANKTIFNDETVQSLVDQGFYPVPVEGGQPEILSSDGEVLVTMKDGVEYTLRFGGVAGIGQKENEADSDAKKTEKTDGKTKEEENQGATLNRFIMVSARFNSDLIPKPDLEAVPGAAEATKTEEEKAQAKSESDANSAKVPAAKTESKEPAAKPDAKAKENAKSSDNAAKKNDEKAPRPKKDDKSAAADVAEELHFVKLQDDTTTASSDKKDGETAKGDESKERAAKSDKKATEAKNDDAKQDDAKKADDARSDGENAKTDQSKSDQEKAALDRKRIEKENERKKKEYDEKITKGEEKAAELNARFAGWYYVVSEATYRKIHLNRDDVIKKKADAKKPGEGAADGTDDASVDPLKLPPLKIDPFQQRDDAKKDDNEKDDGETKGEEKNDGVKKGEEKD
jgi:hypothetical protein